MEKTIFKKDLETIYTGANTIIKKYKSEGVSRPQQNVLITDLLELTNQIVMNNCRKFIAKHSITEFGIEELYSIAISDSLLNCIKWFNFEKGNNFMSMWYIVMQRDFMHHLKLNRFGRVAKGQASVYLDETVGEHGATRGDLMGVEDFSEGLVGKATLIDLINRFIDKDEDGEVISIYINYSEQTARKEALVEFYGEDVKWDSIRKRVQRAKERFFKLLILNEYEVPEFLIKKMK